MNIIDNFQHILLKKKIKSILSEIYLLDQVTILIQKVLRKLQQNC